MQQFDNFAQMQRDAERRVMEMQKRAMAAVENTDMPPISPQTQDKAHDMPEFSQLKPHEKQHELPKHTFPELNLSDEDSERALLIMILFLLLREEADERLILTLLYILI
jgi:hypothetical protein